ncbi:hypothetical protein [Hymenobacter cavernae]|uniref:hypothetical protein n=1 Tax=Hymenobacter cavernae TaxID=2044852 RepID=UPI00166DF7FD|nr:hypothetical protein [Hymenobacter cavernae]
MKNLLLIAIIGLVGLNSCTTKCPAYSSTKPATHVSSPITASTSTTSVARQ